MRINRYIFLIFFFICLNNDLSPAAEIVGIDIGKHSGYSLMVVTCNRDVEVGINQGDGIVSLSFPAGTHIANTLKLSELQDEFFISISFSPETSVLRIETSKNYILHTYENQRPYQLVLDFNWKPGSPRSHPVERRTYHSVEKEPSTLTKPQKSVEGKPSNPPLDPYERGLALAKNGEYRQALEAFKEALPHRGEVAKYQIALMYEELGQREKAIEVLIETINIAPSWLEPRLKLALLYKLSGRNGAAEKFWSQVLAVIEADSNFNFTKYGSQIEYLEQMLNADNQSLDVSMPGLNKSTLPKIPYIPIAIILGVGFLVIAVRLLSNYRMNKMFSRALEDIEEEEDSAQPLKSSVDVDEIFESAIEAEKNDASLESEKVAEKNKAAENMEEGSGMNEITDEKQQMIYDLVDQNYSIAEIAKMLDMGQEEVKFIIDFRRKDGIKQ